MLEISDNFSGEFIQDVAGGKVVIHFVDGKKEGLTTFVSSDNIVLSEISYKDDLIHGKVKQYYPNGSILSISEYENGKQNGPFVSYSENGMEQIRSEYKDNLQDGHFTAFDEFGDVVLECDYIDGLKTGKNLLYYPKSQGGEFMKFHFMKKVY